MKRASLMSPPKLPTSHRKRVLSHEELALWESVARQTKPLRKRKPGAAKPAATLAAEEPVRPQPTAAPKVQPDAKPVRAPPAAARPAAPPLVSLGRRERSQLSRGHKDIDARLDLHGMTQTRAHQALSGFLHRAHQDGLTFVLIITGKGKVGAEAGRGVLRRQVPEWLGLPEFRKLVVGFEAAHINHGGEGALYVRIRRVRG